MIDLMQFFQSINTVSAQNRRYC